MPPKGKPKPKTPAGAGDKGGAGKPAGEGKKAGTARSPAPAVKEEPFAPATVLLLGGYGLVGTSVARTLLSQSSTVKVIIALITVYKFIIHDICIRQPAFELL